MGVGGIRQGAESMGEANSSALSIRVVGQLSPALLGRYVYLSSDHACGFKSLESWIVRFASLEVGDGFRQVDGREVRCDLCYLDPNKDLPLA